MGARPTTPAVALLSGCWRLYNQLTRMPTGSEKPIIVLFRVLGFRKVSHIKGFRAKYLKYAMAMEATVEAVVAGSANEANKKMIE